MAGENEDFGINDPNILALLGGVNNPQAIASLLSSADNMGAMFLPGIKRRQQETTRSVLEMMGENNTARALLHNKKMDIGRLKDQETYVGNMMNHAPNLAKEGILSSASPYDVFFRKPGVLRSEELNLEGKNAYNQNQRMEAMERGANAGYVTDEGAQLDPNKPQLPVTTRDSGRATSVLAALARANANVGKVQAQYAGDDTLVGSTVTLPAGSTPPRTLQGLTPPGTNRDLPPAPNAEQEIRKVPQLRNAQIAKLPNGKGYSATYKSQGKDIVVMIPADPKGRPLTAQLEVMDGSSTP